MTEVKQTAKKDIKDLQNQSISSLSTLMTTNQRLSENPDDLLKISQNLNLLSSQDPQLKSEEDTTTPIIQWVEQLQIPLSDEPDIDLGKYGLISSQLFELSQETVFPSNENPFSDKVKILKRDFKIQETQNHEILVQQSSKSGKKWLDKTEKDLLIFELKRLYLLKIQGKTSTELQKGNIEGLYFGNEEDFSKEKEENEMKVLETKIEAIKQFQKVTEKDINDRNYTYLSQIEQFWDISKQIYAVLKDKGEEKDWPDYIEDMLYYIEEKQEDAEDGQYDFLGEFLDVIEDFRDMDDFLADSLEDFDLDDYDYDEDLETILEDFQKKVCEIRMENIDLELNENQEIQKQIREKKMEILKLQNGVASTENMSDLEQELEKLKELVALQEKKAEEAFNNLEQQGEFDRKELEYTEKINHFRYDPSQEIVYLKKEVEDIENIYKNLGEKEAKAQNLKNELYKISDVLQFELDQEMQTYQYLNSKMRTFYDKDFETKLKNQKKRVEDATNNVNASGSQIDFGIKVYEEEVLKMLEHFSGKWYPLIKQRYQDQIDYIFQIQKDLDVKSQGYSKDIQFIENEQVPGQVELLKGMKNGYFLSVVQQIQRYWEGQSVQMLTNLNDQEKLKDVQKDLEYVQGLFGNNNEIQAELGKLNEKIKKIDPEIAKFDKEAEAFLKKISYNSLKMLKQKKDNQNFFEVQADMDIQQTEKFFLQICPNLIKRIGVEEAINVYKQCFSESYGGDLNELDVFFIYFLNQLFKIGEKVYIGDAKIRIVKDTIKVQIQTYIGNFEVNFFDPDKEDGFISMEIKIKYLQTIQGMVEGNFQKELVKVYQKLGVDTSLVKTNEIENLLKKRQEFKYSEPEIKFMIVEEISGKEFENQLQNNIDIAVLEKGQDFTVILSETRHSGGKRLQAGYKQITKLIYDNLKQNLNHFHAYYQNLFNKINLSNAQKSFEAWIRDLHTVGRYIDVNEYINNPLKQGSDRDLCMLLSLFFHRNMVQQKMQMVDQLNQKSQKQQEKANILRQIELLEIKSSISKEISGFLTDFKNLNSDLQKQTNYEEKKDIFEKMKQLFEQFQQKAQQYVKNSQDEQKKLEQEKNQLQKQQESKFQFTMDDQGVLYQLVSSSQFNMNTVLLSNTKWPNIPNKQDQDALWTQASARALIKVMIDEVNSHDLSIEKEFQNFQLQAFQQKLDSISGLPWGYLKTRFGEICDQIRRKMLEIKTERLNGITREIQEVSRQLLILKEKENLQLETQGKYSEKVTVLTDYLKFLEDPFEIEESEEYKKLQEYLKQLFEKSVEFQLDRLSDFLNYITQKITDTETQGDRKLQLFKVIGTFFKSKYFADLNVENADFYQDLINKIKKESEISEEQSKIKQEIKKTNDFDSVQWLSDVLRDLDKEFKAILASLKSFEWTYFCYKDLLNFENKPEYDKYKTEFSLNELYKLLQKKERELKMEEEKKKIEVLEQEIKELEEKIKDNFRKDLSLIEFEKECLVCIKSYLENYRDIASLEERIEKARKKEEEGKPLVNEYRFRLRNEEVAIELMSEDVEEQKKEIESIQNVIQILEEFRTNQQQKEAQKETYSAKIKEIQENIIPNQTKLLIQIMIKQGIILTGFDQFENGGEIDEIESLIAVLIDRILNENTTYWSNGVNSTGRDLENRVKKIRRNIGSTTVLTEENQKEVFQNIVNSINSEYENDNSQLKKLFIHKQNQNQNQNEQQQQAELIEIESSVEKGLKIVLVRFFGKFFSLQGQSSWKIDREDKESDFAQKVNFLQQMVKGQEDLFEEVCKGRMMEILGEEDFSESEKLLEGYQAELQVLKNQITNLDQFSAIVCKSIGPSQVLFSYLCQIRFYLQLGQDSQSIYSQNQVNFEDFSTEILGNLKAIYSRMLMIVVLAEQFRRNMGFDLGDSSLDQEQQFWLDKLKESERIQQELKDELERKQEEMQETDKELEEQLRKREEQQKQYEEKIKELERLKQEKMDALEASRKKLEELLAAEVRNEEEIAATQKEIEEQEEELKRKEEELKEQQELFDDIAKEIADLKEQQSILQEEQIKQQGELEELQEDLKEKEEEARAGKAFILFRDNLGKLFLNYNNYQNRKAIETAICEQTSLSGLMEAFPTQQKELWKLLSEGIDQKELQFLIEYAKSKKDVFNMNQYELMKLVIEMVHFLIKIVVQPVEEKNSSQAKQKISVYKCKAPCMSLQAVYTTIRKEVEFQMKKKKSGLYFDQNTLKCRSIDKMHNLPQKLRDLVYRKIEIKYPNQSYTEDKRKEYQRQEAAQVINELKIEYKEVISCFIDEIFVISEKFFVDEVKETQWHFPGVDFSLQTKELEVIGETTYINCSGLTPDNYQYKYAASGLEMRTDKQPSGKRGVDGYDGQDGDHGGNILINVENTIKNQKALFLKSNGGNGGNPQFGGDGDEGMKGDMGQTGRAPNTSGFGGQQICVGFGKKGGVGRDGGAPGKTGRPGRAGLGGQISIRCKDVQIPSEEVNSQHQNGVEGDNFFDVNNHDKKPEAGKVGLGGLPGFDQVREKKSFFNKTKTQNNVYVDTGALKEFCRKNKYKRYIPKIEKRENVKMTNSNFFTAIIGGIVGAIIITIAGICLGPAGAIGGGLLAAAILGAGAIGGLVGAFIAAKFADPFSVNEIDELNSIRNNEKTENSYEEEASLRKDEREQQEKQRQERSEESMQKEQNDLEKQMNEVFKQEIFDQYMQNLEQQKQNIDQEIQETQNSLDVIQNQLNEIASQIQSAEMQQEVIQNTINQLREERKKIQEEILKQQEIYMDLTEEQKQIFDQKVQQQQMLDQLINQLNQLSDESLEASQIQQQLTAIINQYIKILQQKLQEQQLESQEIQNELEQQIMDSEEFMEKILAMESTEELQKMMEEMIKQAQEEIENEVDIDIEEENQDPNIQIPDNQKSISWPCELPYKSQTKEFYASLSLDFSDFRVLQQVLIQTIRDLRGNNITQKETDLVQQQLSQANNNRNVERLLENFVLNVEEVKLQKQLRVLPKIDKFLLKNVLNKIYNQLKSDIFHVIDEQFNCEFVFSVLDLENLTEFQTIKNIKSKLYLRQQNLYYSQNDGILNDLKRLTEIIDSISLYYLEESAPNFTQKEQEQEKESNEDQQEEEQEQEKISEFEESLILFNKDCYIDNLLQIGNIYQQQIEQIKSEDFKRVSLTNINTLAVVAIYEIKEFAVSKREDKEDVQQQIDNFMKILEIFENNTSGNQQQQLQQVKGILEKFKSLLENVLKISENKKKSNQILKILVKVVVQILNYFTDERIVSIQDQFLKLTEQKTTDLYLQEFEKLSENLDQIKNKILYLKEDSEQSQEDKEDLEDQAKQEKLNAFLDTWIPILMKKYEFVETLDQSCISDFLIKYYTLRIQHLLTEEEGEQEQIKKFMDEKLNYAYYSSFVAIFRQMDDKSMERVMTVLQYSDLDLFKKTINGNVLDKELEKKLKENEKNLIEEFDNEEEEEDLFSYRLDIEYAVLINQTELNELDISGFKLKFQSRYQILGNDLDVKKVSELLKNQTMGDEEEENSGKTAEDVIFEEVDSYMPQILTSVLLKLENQNLVQEIIKNLFGQFILSLDEFNNNNDNNGSNNKSQLYNHIQSIIIEEKGGLYNIIEEIQTLYIEKKIDLLKLYKYADYEVFLAILEASVLENEELEARLSKSTKNEIERGIFAKEHFDRSKYMNEQIDFELNQVGLAQEENGLKLQKLLENIVQGLELLRKGEVYEQLSHYQEIYGKIVEFKSGDDVEGELMPFIVGKEKKLAENMINSIYIQYSQQPVEQEQLFSNGVVPLVKDFSEGNKLLTDLELGKLLFTAKNSNLSQKQNELYSLIDFISKRQQPLQKEKLEKKLIKFTQELAKLADLVYIDQINEILSQLQALERQKFEEFEDLKKDVKLTFSSASKVILDKLKRKNYQTYINLYVDKWELIINIQNEGDLGCLAREAKFLSFQEKIKEVDTNYQQYLDIESILQKEIDTLLFDTDNSNLKKISFPVPNFTGVSEKFKKLVEEWNSGKNRTRAGIVQLLQEFGSFVGKLESFEQQLDEFFGIFDEILDSQMFSETEEQEIIYEVRESLDLYAERLGDENINKLVNFDRFKQVLLFKNYKSTGLKNVVEESLLFKQKLENSQNVLTQGQIFSNLEKKLVYLVQIRSELSAFDSGKMLSEYLKKVQQNCVSEGEEEKEEEKSVVLNQGKLNELAQDLDNLSDQILLEGIDQGNLGMEVFLQKVSEGKEIKIQDLIQKKKEDGNTETDEQNVQKLFLVIEKYPQSIKKSVIRDFILALDGEQNSWELLYIKKLFQLYFEKIYENIQRIYENNNVSEANLSQILSFFGKFFEIYSLSENNYQKKQVQILLEELNSFSEKLQQNTNNNIQIVFQQVQISLIWKLGLVSGGESQESSSVLTQNVISEYEKSQQKMQFIRLLAVLPDSFFLECQDANLLKSLLKILIQEFNTEYQEEKYDFIIKLLNFLILVQMKVKNTEEWVICNNQICIKRLSVNIQIKSEFLVFIDSVILEEISKIEEFDFKFVISNFKSYKKLKENDLSYLLDLLTGTEIFQIQKLLNSSQEISQALDNLSSQNNDLFLQIQEIFEEKPTKSWEQQLISLRFLVIYNKILYSVESGSGREEIDTLEDVIQSLQFVSFQQQYGDNNKNIEELLAVLEKIVLNIDKFDNNLEAVKVCLKELLNTDNYVPVLTILDNSSKQKQELTENNIIFDILFQQIEPEEIDEMKNAFSMLKYSLKRQKFEEVEYFCKIFVLKMKKIDNFENIQQGIIQVLNLIIESRVYKKQKLVKQIKDKEFLAWKSNLQKEVIRGQISFLKQVNYSEKEKIVELLYQIQDKKGQKFEQKLLKDIIAHIQNLKPKRIIGQLNKILHKNVSITDLDKLINSEDGSIKDIKEWDLILYSQTNNQANTKPLTIQELLAIMQEGDKLNPDGFNYSRKDLIQSEELVKTITSCMNIEQKVKKNDSIKDKLIKDWEKGDLKIWADLFREQYKGEKEKLLNMFNLYDQDCDKELLVEVFVVLSQGVFLFKGYYPRATNLLSVLLFLSNREGRRGSLGNIETGEGKSTIVIILALIHAFCGLKIDILTSSKVLAIRDSQYRDKKTGEGWRDLFDWFGVNCSNNCDEECEDPYGGDTEKKDRYDTCQVIYGEAGYFQRDILLTEFFGKNIRSGKTTADVVIMDEVDNMMIDNAVKTLYISHRIKDFKYLKDIFIRIWSFVNGKDGAYTDENIEKVEEEMRQLTQVYDKIFVDFEQIKLNLDQIASDFPGLLNGKEEQIRQFLLGESSIWLGKEEIALKNQQYIIRQQIIDSLQQLILSENFDILLQKLNLTINKENEDSLLVPPTMIDFVDKNLKSWVQNAYYAKFAQVNDSYILGDQESAGPGEAIIMDKDTGVEQNSTKWSKGLHQFIQLKHNLKLSDESLKAVYLSNLNYFKKYKILYGMSGTVGDKDERSLIESSYNVDFFQLPRFKKYRFLYEGDVESIAVSQQEWLQNIVENVDENIDQQIEYTEEYKQDLKTSLVDFEEEKEETEEKLGTKNDQQKLLIERITKLKSQIDSIDLTEQLSFELINVVNTELEFEQKVLRVQDLVKKLFTILDNSPPDLQEEAGKYKEMLAVFNSIENEYALDKKIEEFQLKLTEINSTDTKNQKQSDLETTQKDLNELNIQIQYLVDSLDSLKSNIETYKQEIERAEKGEKDPHMRPVLIICENILSLQLIEQKIRQEFPSLNIYTYDRAYINFDKMKLDEGDIVIATNIAGRGTSFKVTEKAEKNGGLHVILTYIPGNIRVEMQNFGRTARGGKKGTGTFIVLAQEDSSIPQLKKERDEKEQQRLQNVKEKQFVRIEKEDKLFAQFNEFRKEITGRIVEKMGIKGQQIEAETFEGQYIGLQIDGLKDQFAVWLDGLEKKLRNIYQNIKQNEAEIDKEYDLFKEKIRQSIQNNKYMLICEPGELNRLGRLYYDFQQYSNAIDCFSEIMKHFGLFSEIAEYYSAIALFSKEGNSLSTKKKAKKYLKNSLTVIERMRNSLLCRNQILDTVNQFRSQKSGSYETKQLFQNSNENEAQIFQVYINSIQSQIGEEISGENLKVAADAFGGEEIFKEIMKNEYELVKNLRISKKCAIGNRILEKNTQNIKNLLSKYDNNQELCKFLTDNNNIGFISENSYLTYFIYREFLQNNNDDDEKYTDYKSYAQVIGILQDLRIVGKLEIFKNESTENLGKIVESSERIELRSQFENEKLQQILLIIEDILQQSEKKNWFYQERQLVSLLFSDFLYTKDKFLSDSKDLIEEKHQIKLNPLLDRILMGKLDHTVYQNKGQEVKNILVEITAQMDKRKLGISAKLVDLKYQISQLSRNRDDYLQKVEILRKNQAIYEQLYENLYIVDYSELQNQIKEKTSLSEQQVNEILQHLDKYECISIDFSILESKIVQCNTDYIFQQAKTEILAFLQGKSEVKLENHTDSVKLQDNWPYSKELLQACIIEVIILKKLENVPQNEIAAKRVIIEQELGQTSKKLEIEQLFRLLGFDFGLKQSVLTIFQQLQLKNTLENLPIINEYLNQIDLRYISQESLLEFEKQLDLSSFDKDFADKKEEIMNNLKKFQGKIVHFEEFNLENSEEKVCTNEEFWIIRDILVEQKLINSSILSYLKDKSQDIQQQETNIEQEIIMKALFNNQGILDSKNLLLKDKLQANKEIFDILQIEGILKPAKINFSLGPQVFSPSNYQFNHGDAWKNRENFIEKQIKTIVSKIFSNKSESEKQKSVNKIMNFTRKMAGNLKTEAKFNTELEQIDKKWPDGEVPKEYIEFKVIGFEKILKNFDNSQQDWKGFKTALTGALQIVSGVSVEFLSDDYLSLLPKNKSLEITQNVSQSIFTKLKKMNNDFYFQTQKVNSITNLLSTGIQQQQQQQQQDNCYCGGLVQGEILARNIGKSIFTGLLSGVTEGYNKYSVQNLTQYLMEELINNLFPTKLNAYTKENSQYKELNIQIGVLLFDIQNMQQSDNNNKQEDLIIQQLSETIEEVKSEKSTFIDSLDDLLGFIMDSVSKNLYQKAGQLCRETQKFGVNAGGFVYELQDSAFREAQISDIGRVCAMLSKIQEKFIEKLANLKKYIENPEEVEEIQQNSKKSKGSLNLNLNLNLKEMEQRLLDVFSDIFGREVLKPKQQSALKRSVKFIENQIEKMLFKPQNHLKQHVQNQTEIISSFQDQDNQQSQESDIIDKKMQILEEMGVFYHIEDLRKEIQEELFKKLVNDKNMVNNFEGTCIQDILEQYGSEKVRVYVKDGKFNVVLQNYVDFFRDLKALKMEKSNEFLLKLISSVENLRIKLYKVEKNKDNQDEYLVSFMKSFGQTSNLNNKNEIVCNIGLLQEDLIKYVPLIQDHQNSKKLNVFSMSGELNNEVQNLLQCVLFSMEYEKLVLQGQNTLEEIEKQTENYIKNGQLVPEFSIRLSLIGEICPELKQVYYQGSIMQQNQENNQEKFNKNEVLLSIEESFNEKSLIMKQVIDITGVGKETIDKVKQGIEQYFQSQYKDKVKAEVLKSEILSALQTQNVQEINRFMREIKEIAEIFVQNSVPVIELADWQSGKQFSIFEWLLESVSGKVFIKVNTESTFNSSQLLNYLLVSPGVFRGLQFIQQQQIDIFSMYQQDYLQVVFKLLNSSDEIISKFD